MLLSSCGVPWMGVKRTGRYHGVYIHLSDNRAIAVHAVCAYFDKRADILSRRGDWYHQGIDSLSHRCKLSIIWCSIYYYHGSC